MLKLICNTICKHGGFYCKLPQLWYLKRFSNFMWPTQYIVWVVTLIKLDEDLQLFSGKEKKIQTTLFVVVDIFEASYYHPFLPALSSALFFHVMCQNEHLSVSGWYNQQGIVLILHQKRSLSCQWYTKITNICLK